MDNSLLPFASKPVLKQDFFHLTELFLMKYFFLVELVP